MRLPLTESRMLKVVFRRDEKVKLAQALDELGTQSIEAGMPRANVLRVLTVAQAK